jgi:hypothetical protein
VSDDPRRTLEEAGRRPAPAPDPEFADRLEARLLAVAASLPVDSAPAAATRPAARRRAIVLAGAMASVVALIALFAVRWPVASPGALPELAQPVNVQVALSDGTVLEDPAGVPLPNGAVITVGEGGYAVIAGTELRPGDVAVVKDGRIDVTQGSASATSRPIPTRTPPPRRTSQPGGATSAPTASPSPRPTRSPRVTPTPKPTPTPRPTPPPPTPTPEPVATPTPTPPTATPTPTPKPVVLTARPRVHARLVAGGTKVAVRWTHTRRAHSYLLIVTRSRIVPAQDPVYPGGRVLRQFAHPPVYAFRFGILPRVEEVRVLVIALGKYGHEVSRSVIVVVPTPGE